jgi:hypothetical protein
LRARVGSGIGVVFLREFGAVGRAGFRWVEFDSMEIECCRGRVWCILLERSLLRCEVIGNLPDC